MAVGRYNSMAATLAVGFDIRIHVYSFVMGSSFAKVSGRAKIATPKEYSRYRAMECLYIPEFHAEMRRIEVTDDEFRHGKALRLREGSPVMVSNGTGLCAETVVTELHARHLLLDCRRLLPGYNEPIHLFHLCIGNLDNKDRLEFLVEKAVELGVRSITIVQTRYASQRKLNADRLRTKAIAALKQSRRSTLPEIASATSLSEVVGIMNADVHVLCDDHGTRPERETGTVCLYVGPEGGFHQEETSYLKSLPNMRSWRLASSRLRAETAAISALSHVAAW